MHSQRIKRCAGAAVRESGPAVTWKMCRRRTCRKKSARPLPATPLYFLKSPSVLAAAGRPNGHTRCIRPQRRTAVANFTFTPCPLRRLVFPDGSNGDRPGFDFRQPPPPPHRCLARPSDDHRYRFPCRLFYRPSPACTCLPCVSHTNHRTASTLITAPPSSLPPSLHYPYPPALLIFSLSCVILVRNPSQP